jgi:hypothetical protein
MHSRLWRLIAIVASAVSVIFVSVLYAGLTGHQGEPHLLPVLVLASIAIPLCAIIGFLPPNALPEPASKTRLLHQGVTAYGI